VTSVFGPTWKEEEFVSAYERGIIDIPIISTDLMTIAIVVCPATANLTDRSRPQTLFWVTQSSSIGADQALPWQHSDQLFFWQCAFMELNKGRLAQGRKPLLYSHALINRSCDMFAFLPVVSQGSNGAPAVVASDMKSQLSISPSKAPPANPSKPGPATAPSPGQPAVEEKNVDEETPSSQLQFPAAHGSDDFGLEETKAFLNAEIKAVLDEIQDSPTDLTLEGLQQLLVQSETTAAEWRACGQDNTRSQAERTLYKQCASKMNTQK
jgi:hypothetical protein